VTVSGIIPKEQGVKAVASPKEKSDEGVNGKEGSMTADRRIG